MANTKSAKKAIRSAGKKHSVNLNLRTKYKQAAKAVAKAVETKTSKTEMKNLLSKAYKQIDKAAKKTTNIISKNKAARLKSDLATKTKGLV